MTVARNDLIWCVLEEVLGHPLTARNPEVPLECYGLDSLGVVRLAAGIEEALAVELSIRALSAENFHTVGQIWRMLDTECGEAA